MEANNPISDVHLHSTDGSGEVTAGGEKALSEQDVMAAIVDAMVGAKGRAALSHYASRRLWATRLHGRLTREVEGIGKILESLNAVENKTDAPGTLQVLFRAVIPVLLEHQTQLLEGLLQKSAPLPTYEIGNDGVAKTFSDFNGLLSGCRQYIDSVAEISYQLTRLDAAEFNYYVLSSLVSFRQLAPLSMQVPFITDDVMHAVESFEKGNATTFAKRKVRRFQEVAKYLVNELRPTFVKDRPALFLEAIFRFSSDFAHAGFVSRLVTSTDCGGVYMASPDGVFFASTENYAEVQFLALKSALFAFGDVFLRALRKAIEFCYSKADAENIGSVIDERISRCKGTFDWIGREMHAWISNDAMLRGDDIWIGCGCNTWFVWRKPYSNWDLYCPACGTVFRVTRMRETFSYCILPQGPCDVFGSQGPLIDNLSEELRLKLYADWEKFRDFSKTLPHSEFEPVLLVGDIRNFAMKLPSFPPQQLYTFISGDALRNEEGIAISCNCTFVSMWLPTFGDIPELKCWACGSTIKLRALTGDGGYVFGTVEGKTRLFDVQASRVLPAWRLSEEEKAEIIRNATKRRASAGGEGN